MFSLECGMRYWLYSEPTDMRKSFHTLSGLVRNKIGGDPMNGDVYIFVNKRRNRIKLLHYETGGMVFYAKMSEKNLPLDPTVLSESTLFDDPLTDEERAEIEADVKKDEEDVAKLIQVRGFERKPRKAIDTANLEVREEHIYPEVENREDYTELDPEVTEMLVLVPAQIYVRRIIRHKLVLKSNLQIKDPERNAFELALLPVMPLSKCMASESLLADIILQKFFYHMPFYRVIQKYKELDVNPREWMEDVLLRIPGNGNNREALRELLPDKWATLVSGKKS